LYSATDAQLQRWLLTTLVVAGKQSHIQEKKLGQLYERLCIKPEEAPFERIAHLSDLQLREALQAVRMGQYNRLVRAIGSLSRAVVAGELDLRKCPREALAAFPGIGLKTASYFLLYTRSGARVACLDTHILAWLAESFPDAPSSTPQNPAVYALWESRFLAACDAAGMTPAEMDFKIWISRKTAHRQPTIIKSQPRPQKF